MAKPKVSVLMIAMVIIEPTLEFSTSGLTRPLLGSREQKIAMEMTTNAAPETVRNILHPQPAVRDEGNASLSHHWHKIFRIWRKSWLNPWFN